MMVLPKSESYTLECLHIYVYPHTLFERRKTERECRYGERETHILIVGGCNHYANSSAIPQKESKHRS